jgi:hypothetical protein
MTYVDSYELSTGLPDDVVLCIGSASFGYDAAYDARANTGKTTMLLKLLGYEDVTENTMTHMLSVGADWQTVDGRLIEHPNGKNKINNQSSYGRWLSDCREVPTLWDYIINKGPATDATIWNNLKIHLLRRDFEVTFGGQKSTRNRLVPVAFMGFIDGQQQMAVQQSGGGSQAALTVVPPPATVPLTPEQILAQARAAQAGSSPLRTELLALAKSVDTHNDFVALAVNRPEVMTDDALLAEVMSPTGLFIESRK